VYSLQSAAKLHSPPHAFLKAGSLAELGNFSEWHSEYPDVARSALRGNAYVMPAGSQAYTTLRTTAERAGGQRYKPSSNAMNSATG
jgi:hypothetical protein